MERLRSVYQILFMGLIGLIMVGGHHFGVENREALNSSTSDFTSISEIATPDANEAPIATNFKSTHTALTSASQTPPAPTSQASSNYISIGGRTINIKYVNNTTVNAGNMVAKYGDKLLYGHNSSAVFGHLASLGTNQTFTVTLNNQPSTYRIARIVTLDRDTEVAPNMNTLAAATYYGQTYDLALMTCAGTPRPHQDASHRLIIFANRV